MVDRIVTHKRRPWVYADHSLGSHHRIQIPAFAERSKFYMAWETQILQENSLTENGNFTGNEKQVSIKLYIAQRQAW